jgi:hypothetical protein
MVSFAAKLAAFFLNNVNHDIVWSPDGGFSGSCKEVSGLLPFLHMNVTEDDFIDIISASNSTFNSILNMKCAYAQIESKLNSNLNFKCAPQSKNAADVLVQRIIETINTGYKERKNGKDKARQVATYMKWQCKNNKIPNSSIEWCKGIKSVESLLANIPSTSVRENKPCKNIRAF